jgi:hypothetical protein
MKVPGMTSSHKKLMSLNHHVKIMEIDKRSTMSHRMCMRSLLCDRRNLSLINLNRATPRCSRAKHRTTPIVPVHIMYHRLRAGRNLISPSRVMHPHNRVHQATILMVLVKRICDQVMEDPTRTSPSRAMLRLSHGRATLPYSRKATTRMVPVRLQARLLRTRQLTTLMRHRPLLLELLLPNHHR